MPAMPDSLSLTVSGKSAYVHMRIAGHVGEPAQKGRVFSFAWFIGRRAGHAGHAGPCWAFRRHAARLLL